MPQKKGGRHIFHAFAGAAGIQRVYSLSHLKDREVVEALAARDDALTAVVSGTTLGMMFAHAPAIWMGKVLADRINMKVMR